MNKVISAAIIVGFLYGCSGTGIEGPDNTNPDNTNNGSTQTPPSSGRRLTKSEYLNTVSDALGIERNIAVDLLIDDFEGEGFRNSIDALLPSGNRTDAFEAAAIAVAENISNEALSKFTSCTHYSDVCIDNFLANLGHVIYRGEANEERLQPLKALFQLAQQQGDDFFVGARLSLQAMLQSPFFLYRLEKTSEPTNEFLDVNTLANRLAFFLWQSGPDNALLERLAEQPIGDEFIETIVDQMIADDRFKRSLAAFVTEWLALYKLETRERDTNLYPEYTPQLINSMREETLNFFERLLITERAPFLSVYTDQHSVIDKSLADLYQVTNSGSVDWTNDRRRVGFLTQASVLTVHATADHTSIVDRGLFVLSDLLCQPTPSLPSGTLAAEIADAFASIDPTLPQRTRFEKHRETPGCENCHLSFDGFGYAFEAYSAVGRFLEKDAHDNPIALNGEVKVDDQYVAFDDVTDFANILSSSEWAERCIVEKNLAFAYGRSLDEADKKMVDELLLDFSKDGNYLALIKNIALSEPFLKRVAQ